MSDFAAAYLHGDAFARGLFAAPLTPQPEGQKGDWAYGIADACRAYTAALGVERAVPAGPVVITGQQTGILGGPLYTVLKAITTIQLAERLSQQSGVKHTPVFWLAGDDHDFEEVASVSVVTKEDKPLTLTWQPETNTAGRSMFRVPLDASLDALIEQAACATRGSEWREPILAFLLESRGRYTNLCDWTGALLARMFQDTPLVFFAPHLEPARYQAVPVLAREIEEPLASTRLLIKAGETLAAQGYEVPLLKKPDQCQLFVEREERRCSVRFRDGHFMLSNGESFTPPQMRRLLDDDLGHFSAGAALRPIVQQALFPAAAYVAGPGEIAYWAQLKTLFEFHDLPMPSVYPRARAVLMSGADRRSLDALGWTQSDLLRPEQELVSRALAATVSNPSLTVLRDQQARLEAALAEANEALAEADPRTRDMMHNLSDKTVRGLARIEHVMLHADAQQNQDILYRVIRLQNRLAPGRKPQERVYGSVSWLFEQGWEFVPRLMSQLKLDHHAVQEILL